MPAANGKMPKVERNVPLPEDRPSRAAFVKRLKVGDLFAAGRKHSRSWQTELVKHLGVGKWRMHSERHVVRFWRVA